MSLSVQSPYSIRYTVELSEPYAHRFLVHLDIEQPAEQQTLRLPAWIPGSYMIRDFAKNVVELQAIDVATEQRLTVEKQDKSTWLIQTNQKAIRVSYIVYAWDLSVRSAHFDQTHAYFNGTSLFLEVIGQEDQPCLLDIPTPSYAYCSDWKVATSLKPVDHDRYQFGLYHADNYDDLIDHPVEISDFTLASFEACGVQHDVVLVGKHYADMERLCQDLKVICEYQINFFGTPAPMDYYLFMTLVVDQGYGGLEHRASTSLIANRSDLPHKQDTKITDGYRTYLGLCSHEYFHTWNVKRIKPQNFLPYDLSQEVHTSLMWWFEGVTSYYDNLFLARSGIIPEDSYLECLAQDITRVIRQNGRFRQTVADSSFDTWTRFYKQDEGAPNHIVSYYTKGSLIALGLDLLIQQQSNHQCSLDDVVKHLWQRYLSTGQGVDENEMPDLIQQITSVDVSDYLTQALDTTEDLPLERLLSNAGIEYQEYQSSSLTDLGGKKPTDDASFSSGLRTKPHAMGLELVQVLDNMPGQAAGLSAGDIIIAIDQLMVGKQDIDKLLSRFDEGSEVNCHFFRQDQLMRCTVKLTKITLPSIYLSIINESESKKWIKQ
ncbi:M61 family metallopeptidase [Litoribrevibacter albus]|uniref:Peptidase M61 n=1 Tax=Litoribrevibacter albus TaxID=1473156 RepID=A0AA37S7P9_9GAMM|nr:PDZ domain-containing protein [Litoribrevibacter albus]GLQ30682.1 peptidase M61 [Litoribrevibacter albus]